MIFKLTEDELREIIHEWVSTHWVVKITDTNFVDSENSLIDDVCCEMEVESVE